MDIVILLLIICILSCSIPSSVIAFYWYDEVVKLQLTGDEAQQSCKKNDNLLFRRSNKYLCQYDKNACDDILNEKYSPLFCPLNPLFVKDSPLGNRSKVINSILTFSSKWEDVFNPVYFQEKDLRKGVVIYTNDNLSKIQNIYPTLNIAPVTGPNNNKFINIKSGDLIKISYSIETDSNNKQYKDYYIYAIYNLIVTLPISIGLGANSSSITTTDAGEPIVINSLKSLKIAFSKMESGFNGDLNDQNALIQIANEEKKRRDPNAKDNTLINCDNVSRDVRKNNTKKQMKMLENTVHYVSFTTSLILVHLLIYFRNHGYNL